MAALTESRNTVLHLGGFASPPAHDAPMAASETIYGGSMVCRNASGYAVSAANTADFVFAGIAKTIFDNSSGAAAAMDAEIYYGVPFEMTIAGAALTDVGRPVFITDDQTLSLYGGNVPVGHIWKYISATSVMVMPGPVRFGYVDIPVALSEISADADVGDGITATFNYLITKTSFHVLTKSTGAGADVDLKLEIGTTDVTGGDVTLTLATTNTAGDVVDGAAITAENYVHAGDVLQVDADHTTDFTAGDGLLRVHYAR